MLKAFSLLVLGSFSLVHAHLSYRSLIDTNLVKGGTPAEAGTYEFVATLHYPELPFSATKVSAQVETVVHDPHFPSSVGYQCTTTATFPAVTMYYTLRESATKKLVWKETRQIPLSVSESTEEVSVAPKECPIRLDVTRKHLLDARIHGQSFRVELSKGTLVLLPFEDGFEMTGTLSLDKEIQMETIELNSHSRRLHWGFHLLNSQNPFFHAWNLIPLTH